MFSPTQINVLRIWLNSETNILHTTIERLESVQRKLLKISFFSLWRKPTLCQGTYSLKRHEFDVTFIF